MIELETENKIIQRIFKVRCSNCGCRNKKLKFLTDINNTSNCIGFATVCCNCNEIHKFSIRSDDKAIEEADTNNIISGKFNISNYICGTDHAFCPNVKCPYWIESKHPDIPIPYNESVYKPGYEEIKSDIQHNKIKTIKCKNEQKTYL